MWKVLASVCITFYLALAVYANAADMTVKTIAVLDGEKISAEAKALKGFQDRLEDVSESYQKEVKKYQDTIKKAQTELREQRAKLSDEEFQAKAKEYEKKVAGTQSKILKRKKAIDETILKAKRIFRDELAKHIKEYANEKKIDVIFRASELYWHGNSFDITSEIKSRVDKSLPSIKVSFPK